MPFNEYKRGPAMPGVTDRTTGKSAPAWPGPRRAKKGAASVLFIVIDDTGFGQLSCYGAQVVPENVAAKLLNRAHSITVEAEIPEGGAEGVLMCHGSNVGGHTLFVQDGRLNYVHNHVGAAEFHVESVVRVPTGKVSLRYEFEPTGKPDLARGRGAPGKTRLYIDDEFSGELRLPYTMPLAIGPGSGVAVGRNPGLTISTLYPRPFAFTGTIHAVTIDVSGKLQPDAREQEAVHTRVGQGAAPAASRAAPT